MSVLKSVDSKNFSVVRALSIVVRGTEFGALTTEHSDTENRTIEFIGY